jgi:hypothetical protein
MTKAEIAAMAERVIEAYGLSPGFAQSLLQEIHQQHGFDVAREVAEAVRRKETFPPRQLGIGNRVGRPWVRHRAEDTRVAFRVAGRVGAPRSRRGGHKEKIGGHHHRGARAVSR